MNFQVIGPDGRSKMHTEYESCIPYEHIESMSRAGYSFKLDGKKVSKSQVLALRTSSPDSRGRSPGSQDTSKHDVTFVIKCIETGKVYAKQSEAARDLNIDPAQVSDSIKTGRPRSGYTFVKEEV